MRVLMVCLGNICRSPIAEELLRIKCNQIGLTIHVDSAGTANYHVGEAPDNRMVRTAQNYGINISNLRARQFKLDDFDNFDLILAMDKDNLRDLIARCSKEEHKQKLLKYQDFAEINSPTDVPDPYYGTSEDFIETFTIIDESSTMIANKLKRYADESR